MNAPFRAQDQTPDFAPKAPRHIFTVDDVLRFQDEGLFSGEKRIALHDGDIVHMGGDGFRHIGVTMAFARHIFVTFSGRDYFVGVQTTLQLSRTNAPSPDIYILHGGPPQSDIASERIALVIEVADTSLAADLTDSATRYARAGVEEFWVVDAEKREIHMHRAPRNGAYPPPMAVAADDAVQALRIPELTVVLDQVAP